MSGVKRVLIGTNQLERLSGSETVAFEFASHFLQRGAQVSVFANWAGRPMRRRFEKAGMTIEINPALIRPLTFDLVYMQHKVAPLFSYEPDALDKPCSVFAAGRLSPDGLLESGAWIHDDILADVVFANSEETARSLAAQGETPPVRVFHNAAPADYHRPRRRPLPEAPRSVLVVTNHDNPAVLQTIDALRAHSTVLHVGRSGDRASPIYADLIQKFDLVVSIGKTVQYALAGRTPVFVYDHLGGPGYLDEKNFARAADLNFSGRCTPGLRSPQDAVVEILDGYHRGKAWAASTDDARLQPYVLAPYLDGLLQQEPSSNADRRAGLQQRRRELHKERLVAEYIRKSYRKLRRMEQQLSDLERAGEGL